MASGQNNISPYLEKVSVGSCQTCLNPEIIRKKVNEQRDLQKSHNDELLKRVIDERGTLEQTIEVLQKNSGLGSKIPDKPRQLPKDLLKPGKSDW